MVNEVTLIGRLGQDAETGTVQGNKQWLRWSMATTETWFDANNQKQERTEWHTCVKWGNVANLVPHMTKGKQVYVRGSIRSREFEQNGERRRVTEINVQALTLLGDAHGGQQGGQRASQGNQQRAPQGGQQRGQQGNQQGGQGNQQRAPQGGQQRTYGGQQGGGQRTYGGGRQQQQPGDYDDQGAGGGHQGFDAGSVEDDIPY